MKEKDILSAGQNGKSSDIDWIEFEKLCSIQCTEVEIAAFFRVTVKTLGVALKKHYGKDFYHVFAEKRVPGLISLRRAQFRLALGNGRDEKPDRVMLIWLGKQVLGQADKQEAVNIDISAKSAISSKSLAEIKRELKKARDRNEALSTDSNNRVSKNRTEET